MTGRPLTLQQFNGGMSLLRLKGGARRNALRDILNGYVDHDGVIQSREGTTGINAGANIARGLIGYKGELVTFAHQPLTLEPSEPAVRVQVLVNRNGPETPIHRIHFAGEYMGLLYVVAEYDNGDVMHFWLQSVSAWEPNKPYLLGSLVLASADTGYVYQAGRTTDPYPAWTAGGARALGDRVEPTVQTGWYYEVTEAIGDNPRSGTVEPTWPQTDGAVVYEDVDTGPSQGGAPLPPVDTTLPPDLEERYSNPSGGLRGVTDSRSEQ